MDTAAHDTSSSDLDESALEHVFVRCVKENICKIMPGSDNKFTHLLYFLNLCENLIHFVLDRCGRKVFQRLLFLGISSIYSFLLKIFSP